MGEWRPQGEYRNLSEDWTANGFCRRVAHIVIALFGPTAVVNGWRAYHGNTDVFNAIIPGFLAAAAALNDWWYYDPSYWKRTKDADDGEEQVVSPTSSSIASSAARPLSRSAENHC